MSAFNTATILLFPGIGLVALAIGLLARRYSISALVVGLTGLLTLAATSTWITATGPVTDATQLDRLKLDNDELKAAIARQQADLEETRKRPPETAEVERLDRELQAEKARRGEAEQSAAAADRRVAATAARVSELDEKVHDAQAEKAEAEGRAVILEDKLRGIPPPATTPPPPDILSIRHKLTEGGLPHYAAQEVRELIPGRMGRWYVVRLLQDGREWNFADRQFVLPDAAGIKSSASHLRDDILLPLSQAGLSWRLFVRGVADARRVTGPASRELSFLPRLSDRTYSPQPSSKRLTVPIENDELPTLRAEWLREIVRPVFGAAATSKIEILENPPQPEFGRTAELVLFVEW